jgi:peptide/nickel transport system ATP-binding protein
VTEPLLELDGLCTDVRTPGGVTRVLQDVSFAIAPGEVLSIVGEAGAGKSTLVDAVLGQTDPPFAIRAGRVMFQGEDLLTLAPEVLEDLRGRRIAALLPDPASALHPLLTIEAQMLEGILAHHEIPPQAARTLARAAMMRVGMLSPEEWLHAYPHELGPGARQRAAMAIALVHEPALVVADEPAEALDATAKGQILLALQEFLRETGAAMLLATRDLELATAFADRLAIMHAGRVVEAGRAADLIAAPAHPYTRALINALPSRAGARARLRAQPGPTAAQARRAVGCTYRSACERSIGSCVAVPGFTTIGDAGQRRVVRCFNPLPLIRVGS